jgi:hypothetical protein
VPVQAVVAGAVAVLLARGLAAHLDLIGADAQREANESVRVVRISAAASRVVVRASALVTLAATVTGSVLHGLVHHLERPVQGNLGDKVGDTVEVVRHRRKGTGNGGVVPVAVTAISRSTA